MLIFNSRDKAYKSKISAIATDELCKLRIIVPRACRCSHADLAVTKDGEDTVRYGMFWAGMCGDDYEYWQLHFSAQSAGLYFYHFELDTPWGKSFVFNAGGGRGELGVNTAEFQQTVYDAAFVTPSFLKGGVMYQIFPDRFFNSGKIKNNVPSRRVMRQWGDTPFWEESQMNGVWNNDFFGGDLAGIEMKLPYLASLGVTCIYLNPIFEAHSNHRYDTADYEKIDPLLGSEDDLVRLCKVAEEKYSISIILDGVFSHTGCDSKYFNKYSNYNSIGAYNSKTSPYFSWYKFNSYPDDYKSWWGIKLLPEVNEDDNSYRTFICGENGVLRKWLRCGVSGFRLDVADELPDLFLDDLRRCIKDENNNAIIIGEVWEDATNKFAYSQRRRYLLGSQLDSVMNYPFADAVINFVKYADSDAFFNCVMTIVENYPPQVLCVLMNHIGTHDTARAITRLVCSNIEGKDRRWQYEHSPLTQHDYQKGVSMLKMASLIQFTLPGVPCIYYGDEIGMQGMTDPFNRLCMQWDNQNTELLDWYKNLSRIRKSCSAFADGEFTPVFAKDCAIAYSRCTNDNCVLVAVNNSSTPAQICVGSQWDCASPLLGFPCKNGVISLPEFGCSLLSK